MKKNPTSIRLSEETKRLLSALADRLELTSKSQVITLAVKELARKWGIK